MLTTGSTLGELANNGASPGAGAPPVGPQIAQITQAPPSSAVTLAWIDSPELDQRVMNPLVIWREWLDELNPSLRELRELIERLAIASKRLTETTAEADATEATTDK